MIKHAARRPDVAVATITWARSATEERLLRRSLLGLARTGFPMAVADSGRRRSFANFLRSRPEFTTTVESAGLIAQVEASLRLARQFGTRFILYTEPDKEHFFARLGEFVRRATARSEVDLAIAARSTRSFRTYPPMQRYTEAVINRLCGNTLGCRGDFSYGPFLLPRALVRDLLPLPPHLGWGWRHYAFHRAVRRGLRVRHLTGEYPCPLDQRVEDASERAHRLRQLSQNIQGLLA
jgi:hypothetical protein